MCVQNNAVSIIRLPRNASQRNVELFEAFTDTVTFEQNFTEAAFLPLFFC